MRRPAQLIKTLFEELKERQTDVRRSFNFSNQEGEKP
jgi:hypothetical protein